MFNINKRKYGIVFSGGGSRGLAHIGVMKAMSEFNISPEIFAGASMGAIVGAFFAAGYNYKEVTEIANDKNSSKLFMINMPKLGFAGHDALYRVLEKYLPDSFEALKYQLFISTTNLTSGENEIMNTGPLLDRIVASSSIPIVFKPVKIKNDFHIDGGLTNNMPAHAIRDHCKTLIGSHVNYLKPDKSISNMKQIAERSFRIAIYNTVKKDKELCDFFIDPPEVRKFNTLDFKHIDEIIDIGYRSTIEQLKEKKMARPVWKLR